MRGEQAQLCRALSVAAPRITELLADPGEPGAVQTSMLVGPITAHYGWPEMVAMSDGASAILEAVTKLPPKAREIVFELAEMSPAEIDAWLVVLQRRKADQ